MTAKQADTMNWIYRGITAIAWCACATIYGSVNSRLSRIEDKLEAFKSTQDIDHTSFRVNLGINTSRLSDVETRVRNLEIGQQRNNKQMQNINSN